MSGHLEQGDYTEECKEVPQTNNTKLALLVTLLFAGAIVAVCVVANPSKSSMNVDLEKIETGITDWPGFFAKLDKFDKTVAGAKGNIPSEWGSGDLKDVVAYLNYKVEKNYQRRSSQNFPVAYAKSKGKLVDLKDSLSFEEADGLMYDTQNSLNSDKPFDNPGYVKNIFKVCFWLFKKSARESDEADKDTLIMENLVNKKLSTTGLSDFKPKAVPKWAPLIADELKILDKLNASKKPTGDDFKFIASAIRKFATVIKDQYEVKLKKMREVYQKVPGYFK